MVGPEPTALPLGESPLDLFGIYIISQNKNLCYNSGRQVGLLMQKGPFLYYINNLEVCL
jgi:hypothetical protein